MEEFASATKPVFSIADEGRALRNLMWMWWITAVTYNAVAIPVIWDPAQHSFLVRDSTWTPPHLMIFGPFFALMMFEAIVFQFYALKKAQPYIRGDIPITLWVFPITVFGFTLGSMLTNEIGHIFLFREEFFSMPTHWNFVLMFMFIYAVGVPEVVRVLLRMGQLEARAKELVAVEVPAPMPVGAPARAGRPVARNEGGFHGNRNRGSGRDGTRPFLHDEGNQHHRLHGDADLLAEHAVGEFADRRRRLGVLDRLEGLRVGAVRLYVARRDPLPGLFVGVQQVLQDPFRRDARGHVLVLAAHVDGAVVLRRDEQLSVQLRAVAGVHAASDGDGLHADPVRPEEAHGVVHPRRVFPGRHPRRPESVLVPQHALPTVERGLSGSARGGIDPCDARGVPPPAGHPEGADSVVHRGRIHVAVAV